MNVGPDGAIADYKFYPAVMHSRARLTYTQVWDWLSDPKKAPRETKALLPHLTDLYALYHALKAAREARGAIDFDTVEMQLEFDVRGKIVRVVPVVRNDAHKLIEECMLAANVCTAQFLERHKHPALYRVHEGPDAGETRGAPRFPRELRAVAARRRCPDGVRLREAAPEDQGPPRLCAAADGAAALAAAGALPARQRRPLRPFVRGLCALHVADPALSRSARASRDQGGARASASTSLAAHRGRSSASIARSPSGAPMTQRATSRTGSSATSCRTRSARSLRRHDQRRHELRHLRHAGRPQHRRPRPRHRARARLFPVRRRPARDDRRAQRAASSSSPAASASPSRASTSNRRRSTSRSPTKRHRRHPLLRRARSTASRSPAAIARRRASRAAKARPRCRPSQWRIIMLDQPLSWLAIYLCAAQHPALARC